uniref:RING-type domain-containing protein n=1 Tax=viral metagenome TaxID=1070528 RepID=A0A6C0AZK4_9ZZZZ
MEGQQDYDSIGLFALSSLMNNEAKDQIEEYEFHEAERNFLQAIALNNDAAMMNLAVFYEENDGEHDDIVKYYMMAITASQCPISMYNLADYYKKIGDIDNMKKFFAMAIDEAKDIASMLHLSCYYYDNGDYDNMKMYFIMALQNAAPGFHFERRSKVLGLNFNPFLMLDALNSVTEVELPNLQMHKQELMSTNKFIMIYQNKVSLFEKLNHVLDCGICYEEKLNIDLRCGHCVCTDCYQKLYAKVCPFCRL